MSIGIFTTIKVKNDIPLFFDKHKQRLLMHAKDLHLEVPSFSLQDIMQYVQNNNLRNCALTITITNKNDKPSLSLHKRPFPKILNEYRLITIPDTRDALKIYKTTNRTINEQAKLFAEKHHAQDAIFTQNDSLIESTICNIFSLNKKGEIVTPPIAGRGLNGITRQIIMEQAAITEEDIPQNTNGPLVLVNSLRIQKISQLNGAKLADANMLFQKIKAIITNKEKDYLQKF